MNLFLWTYQSPIKGKTKNRTWDFFSQLKKKKKKKLIKQIFLQLNHQILNSQLFVWSLWACNCSYCSNYFSTTSIDQPFCFPLVRLPTHTLFSSSFSFVFKQLLCFFMLYFLWKKSFVNANFVQVAVKVTQFFHINIKTFLSNKFLWYKLINHLVIMGIMCLFACNRNYMTTDFTIPLVIYVMFSMIIYKLLFNIN